MPAILALDLHGEWKAVDLQAIFQILQREFRQTWIGKLATGG
jgi:hypothetical protein